MIFLMQSKYFTFKKGLNTSVHLSTILESQLLRFNIKRQTSKWKQTTKLKNVPFKIVYAD